MNIASLFIATHPSVSGRAVSDKNSAGWGQSYCPVGALEDIVRLPLTAYEQFIYAQMSVLPWESCWETGVTLRYVSVIVKSTIFHMLISLWLGDNDILPHRCEDQQNFESTAVKDNTEQ